MLNYEYPPIGGGGSYACKSILQVLANKKMKVDLVTSSPSDYFETETINESVNIYKLPVNKKDIHYWTQQEILTYSWKAKQFIEKLLLEKTYDICHTFFGIPCGAVAYLFKENLPYVVSLRGSDVPGFNDRFSFQYILLKPLINRIWRESSAVVANSEGLKELALESSPSQDISVINNGINISDFKPDINSINNNINNHTYKKIKKFNIVCISRLIERKGISFLLKAIKKIKNKKVKLILVGKGKQEDELHQLAKDLEITDRVEFKGYVDHDDIADIYQESDLFVLPSFNEGMSNALLEAMASGLPVISTDTGGTSELIDGNGILIQKGNSDEIAQAISTVMNDPEAFKQMGLRSREIAETMSWEAVAEEYCRLYMEIV
ncbi:MAG: glycosyltransferase family 4 protein [Methanosarcinales archaeon]|nr:glycosyltransferase family 4 protein [Methanosarcinales archaeon]